MNLPAITTAMAERAQTLSARWRFIDDLDYARLDAQGPISPLVYIAIPVNHPLVGRDGVSVGLYLGVVQKLVTETEGYDYGPDVNGGITFQEDNVFGWDYAHYQNTFDFDGDFERALAWFREREVNSNLEEN
mgnify:CR=1 FL=1